MKKLLSNAFFKTYISLIFNLFLVEIIFKLISDSPIFNWSTIRILMGLNILTLVFTFLLHFANKVVSNIVSSILVFAASVYACIQLGFYNFLGVYISFQTSSQLGAVTSYIKDFVKSFKPIYFLCLIPFALYILYIILTRKKEFNKDSHLKTSIKSLIILVVSVSIYTSTILVGAFQNKLQAVSNKDLFLTASNPSVTVDQYGVIGFCFLDVKALIFPVVIEEEYEIVPDTKKSINENSRIIDDSAWKLLINSETNSDRNFLNNYFINREIKDKNDFTGMFEGKNLIVIMMESVNDIMLNPEFYPNFNKMVSEGWYFENNYSPRNSCATMNNEFSGMTSLYSIYNTCTASKYKRNNYYESMFNLFNDEGYVTFSAHDYTEAYYPRATIHPNMGSKEYYGVQKLGISYSNEYRNWADDDDFFKKVLKIIDKKTANKEHFMTWLTTVSSHQPYSTNSIQGNRYYNMTRKKKYPSDVRRYMSKLKVLDNAFGVLLKGLEERGILDDTVIVMYGDHYPYGISTSHLNKALDYNASKDLNMERVPFVIYNSKMESKVFTQYTSYINILPTVANLFNLNYDPRLYLGDDLLSDDYQSLTVFADGSWKNEYAYYNASRNKIKYYSSFEYSPEEIKKINDDISTKIKVSSKAIKSNYFKYLGNNLSSNKEMIDEMNKTMCVNSIKEEYSIEEDTEENDKDGE